MPQLRCPTCDRRFQPEQTTAMPFCSPRCREIDLYRWLNEEYSLPVERDEQSPEDAEPPEPAGA